MRKTRTSRSHVLRDVLVGVAITGALLIVGELGVRVYWYTHAYALADELLVIRASDDWSPRPGFRKGEVEINSMGFRGGEISAAKPPGTFRVVALGDSVTFGHRIRRDGTYPARLEARLDARRDCRARIKVINAAVPGYQTRHVLHRLNRDVRPLGPDLLLVLSGWNDLWSDDPYNPAKRLDPASPFNRLLRASYLAKALTKVAFDLRSPIREVSAEARRVYETFVPFRFMQDYEEVLKAGETMGARLVVLTLPSLLGSPDWHREAQRLHFPHFTTNLQLLALLWEKYNASIRDLAGRRGNAIIDLARLIALVPGSERLFTDTNHLSLDGADVVVGILERALLAGGLLPCNERATNGPFDGGGAAAQAQSER